MQFYYCYILYSPGAKEIYISNTNDLKKAVLHHNNGEFKETSKHKPWNLLWYSAFRTEELAKEFVTFLKSSDGEMLLNTKLVLLTKNSDLNSNDRPENSKTCPICSGSGKAANDISFYRGNRYSKNITTCLTCIGKGWIEKEKDTTIKY